MTTVEEATTTQQQAAERVRRRTGQRHQKIEAITTGQLVPADEPIRIASRIERLSRYYPSVRPVSPAALVANDPEAVQAAGAVLERIINTPDFALVAVAAGPQELAPFGFNHTIAAKGKAIAGDFVTIVQHPGGQKKQVALRDNRIVDVFDAFLHYAADTELGSSGSPVFNDQWELVALHHASAPASVDGAGSLTSVTVPCSSPSGWGTSLGARP